MIEVPVSCGELLDKITILAIKAARIVDPVSRRNVGRELTLLRDRWSAADPDGRLGDLSERLQEVNQRLWDVEDHIRDCERAGEFGPRFVELARAVYVTNDERAAIKREINLRLSSGITEEKSYASYARSA